MQSSLLRTWNITNSSFFLCLALVTFGYNQLQAQTPTYQIYPSTCIYEGASYHVAHPNDWDYYECNEQYMVKWKRYSPSCQVTSVTYGADSPDCLCDGTLRLEFMTYLCLDYCEDITLPPCRGGGSESSLIHKETLASDSGTDPTGQNLLCSDPCGSGSGESCPTFSLQLSNISYCIVDGIIGTIVDASTGDALDCVENGLIQWNHWIPNPSYPQNSNNKYIVNASGTGSDVGSCLCGGTLQMKIRNACCELFVSYYTTPPCAGVGGGGSEFFGDQQPFDDVVGIAEIFPNPATDNFTLQLPTGKEINAQLQIYAQDGRLVKQAQNITETTSSIEVTDLPSGIYWVRVTGSDNFTEKIVIQK